MPPRHVAAEHFKAQRRAAMAEPLSVAVLQGLPTPMQRVGTGVAASKGKHGPWTAPPSPGPSSASTEVPPEEVKVTERPKGPEPWALQDPSAEPRRNLYREQLQARGQEALQRSWEAALAAGAAAGAASSSQDGPHGSSMHGMLLGSGLEEMMANEHALAAEHALWGMPGQWPEQQAVMGEGVASGQLSAWVSPMEVDEQLSRQLQLWDSINPMAIEAMAGHAAWCQDQQLLHLLMPGAPSLDKEHIAAELRAVAPCTYDD